ncbi:MAG: hypothetical protein GX580_00175 [Candidatus Hydrogenedens sp.]|nr:hypothetical protein [Candidatus Hydrogenedentota bacterium]NLF56035.1 hypothetical protein [Candidatus Hydrogenedens sp.]
MTAIPSPNASEWLQNLETAPDRMTGLRAAYGTNPDLVRERACLLAGVVRRFMDAFGDRPVRLFRSPGRLNLRGMHVDTHGGYLNLMTHHRETVVAACASGSTECRFVNLESVYNGAVFNLAEERLGAAGEPWDRFIARDEVRARVAARRETPGRDWENYLAGACLRAVSGAGEAPMGGLLAAVGSDLPRGAALSSSAALCVSVLLAMRGVNGVDSPPEELIRAEQDAEWYAGARVGMSDQGAMILGRAGHVLNVALFAEDFSLDGARWLPWPEDWDVLVVNSHTRRSLSGAQLVDYTRNRFAYSMAMHVLRRELRGLGMAEDVVRGMDRLSRITPDRLGGLDALYALLRGMPESLTLDELRSRYAPPDLDEAYLRYFGGVDPALRPDTIRLRGPLAFGVAESERARVFAGAVAARDAETVGRLMSLGHDGDRVRSCGAEFRPDLDDGALDRMAAARLPIEYCPGAYGASSPVLDFLVDGALEAGALGACLTGAGIAGAVLALCRNADTARVARRMRECLASSAYRDCGGRREPLTDAELDTAVVVNRGTAGAGEILP